MICKGINEMFCIERNMGPLRNPELFCSLCQAENKTVPLAFVQGKPCKYAVYTNRPFTGCKTCNGVVVECQNAKQWPKKRNSKTCNNTCKFFEI